MSKTVYNYLAAMWQELQKDRITLPKPSKDCPRLASYDLGEILNGLASARKDFDLSISDWSVGAEVPLNIALAFAVFSDQYVRFGEFGKAKTRSKRKRERL